MRTRLFLIASLLTCLTNVSAQSWHDVTDVFIVNPRFDNNDVTTGWLGTPFSAYKSIENAEHYWTTFDSYQEIKGLMPNARYRLHLQAFYRYGTAEDDYNTYRSGNYEEYQYARLYAESGDKYYDRGISLLGSGANEYSYGGVKYPIIHYGADHLYAPNSMEAAYYWFKRGYYRNSVDFISGSDGTARIGVKKDVVIDDDWVCLDNWALEFYGEVVNVSSINLSDSSLDLDIGEEKQLTYTILPDNSTYKKVIWTSSDPSIATVDADGVVTAVGPGTATITARSAFGKLYDEKTQSVCSVSVIGSTPAPPPTTTISLNILTPEGYATFYSEEAYEMPEGMRGAVATVSGSSLVWDWAYPAGSVVPKETPILLYGAEGEHTAAIAEGGIAPAVNHLHVATLAAYTSQLLGDFTNEYKYYALTYNNWGMDLGFYWRYKDGRSFLIPQGKVFLALPSAVNAPSRFVLADEETAIKDVESTESGVMHSLSGLRVNDSYKGIVIKNGKKMLIK